jgi:outer membrane protein assembly factor BamB
MRFLLAFLAAVAIAQTSLADNWPQWRGPNATGVAEDGDYPEKFSADQGLLWKAPLPGIGSSSPVTWGDSIFVTCIADGQDTLCCYEFEGNQRWEKRLGPGREGKHKNGSGANPSPATDGMHVVSYFKSGRVACHDFAGNETWQKNLQEEYGKDTLWWDLGTSPILIGGNVVIAVMQEGDSYLVALNAASGEVAWKQKRQYERPEESDQAYTTPQVANVDGRDVIVTWGADHLTGHDAKTGELLWDSAGFNPNNEGMWRVIASHAMGDGIAVVPFGRGRFLAGVKLSGSGDVTESNRLWEKQGHAVGADVPTPIVHDGKAYVVSDVGEVACRDLKTGEELWSDKLPRDRDKYYASPVLADGKLYFAREDGMVFVASVGDDGMHLLAENDMGERVIATPVPVRNSILIRGEQHLFRAVGGEATASTGGR